MHHSLKLTWLSAALITALSLLPLHAAEQVARPEPPPAKTKTTPAAPSRDAAVDKAAPQTRVELNSATQEQLEALPGIGPVMAKAIIDARPFKNVNELTNVTGISHAKLATLKPMVTVRPIRPAATANATKPVPTEKSAPRPGAPATSGVGKSAPTEKGSATSTARTAPAPTTNQKINLNTATKEELESLPGIGPVRAQAIIDGRPYSTPEDVMKVNGIKEGIYNEIKDQVIVK